jgi:uncharacterized protein (DUF4415 family)
VTSCYPKNRLLTDREEAAIQAKIASDPDAPEATDEQLAKAKPFTDAFPALAASIKRSRGRPSTGNARHRFMAAGDDWRTRMSEALEKAAKRA